MSFDASELTGLGSVLTAAGGKDNGGGGGGGGNGINKLQSVIANPLGALACVFPGAAIGDIVASVTDLTGVLTSVQAATHFEGVVSVAGQVQQLSGFPGANVCVLIGLAPP